MVTIEKSIIINAPVEAVFAYAADPNHLPEYYADVTAVKHVRQLPNGGYACTLVPHDAPMETSEVIPNARIVLRGKWCGPMDDVRSTTTFERLASNQTRVTSHEEHTFHGGVFGRIGEKGAAAPLDHAAEMALAALKAHIEAQTPATTSSSS